MTDYNLSMRPIGENDYSVIREGRAIGRIMLADERPGQPDLWSWNITVPLPMPSWGAGRAPSMQAAKVAFREAWVRFYDDLAASAIEHWHRSRDGAKRAEWLGWT